jgi:hypothetical protein
MRPLAQYQQKDRMGCFVFERFPGSVVEFFHHLVNILVGYVLKTAASCAPWVLVKYCLLKPLVFSFRPRSHEL